MKENIEKVRLICNDFVEWQDNDGGIDVSKCPFLQEAYRPLFRYMEIPFMARALYGAFDLTNKAEYKNAADKYCKWYVKHVETLITKESIAYKFGIAIESACLYAKHNPSEARDYMIHAMTILSWLRQLRTDEGSYFRCGYLPGTESLKHVPDVGFSDDLCHVGRGLTRLYEATGDPGVLKDIKGLCGYFMRDIKEGTMDGIWMAEAGTWAIGPWPDTAFEHMENTPANSIGWVWSAFGDVDFLVSAAMVSSDEKLKDDVLKKAVRSNRWIFENCQFDDGAVGMTGRDDKWTGLTSAAIMAVMKLYRNGLMTAEETAEFKPYVSLAWEWLQKNTGKNMPEAGYIKVTGHTNPFPGDNVAWLFSWTAECLMMAYDIERSLYIC